MLCVVNIAFKCAGKVHRDTLYAYVGVFVIPSIYATQVFTYVRHTLPMEVMSPYTCPAHLPVLYT